MSEPAVAVNPNDLTERAAMGLPEAFVDRVDQDRFTAECARLYRLDPTALARTAEDPSAGHLVRLAAGSLLALLGDPRTDTWSPVMLDIPAARVRLGLPEARVADIVAEWSGVGVIREWIAKETPVHEVELASFRIARYPVTNAEYRTFLLADPAVPPPSSWQFGAYPAAMANHPVWTVSPRDADRYAAWLSARTGRRFRLPTEAEWEYAAAGPDGQEYPWGDEPVTGRANTVEAGPLTTTPVGIYPAGRSPFGVDDMAGNVEEYVSDDYRPYPGGPAVRDDLIRAEGERYRVARGGSFTRYGDLARSRRRHGWYHRPIYAMGFRLAETPARIGGERHRG
ncbi:formylglycine-generating enzyme family protein [Streptomyces luteolus]|uniref:SUMF1/EgtB/PvdO family nonheme iron enzyme n=1 Tax=Streptomyces luteolus TaxID=3043615 RepID=A0ABT6T7F6_9ACTN|nr:SUMF1/EgtB/PvdO family nonheme iron enzyme [Streptomyces sp. B-S-A12]MDI3423828.1 SUMF1/EgtB/PvdO family nonheme iron enzyme [Streptomyces sp. B-S-A12]